MYPELLTDCTNSPETSSGFVCTTGYMTLFYQDAPQEHETDEASAMPSVNHDVVRERLSAIGNAVGKLAGLFAAISLLALAGALVQGWWLAAFVSGFATCAYASIWLLAQARPWETRNPSRCQ
jgi:hypothetical protein